MTSASFDKTRIFGYESRFQHARVAKGPLGLVDHSEDFGSRLDFAGKSQADCPELLRGPAWPLRLLRSPSLTACIVRRTLGSLVGVVLLIALIGGFVFLYLSNGPVALAGMGTRITKALNERVGHGYVFRSGPVSLSAHGLGPTLAITNLTLVDKAGDTIISAPRAEVSVDMTALLFGKVIPKRLEIYGIEVRMELLPDGSLAVSAGGGQQAATPLFPLAVDIGDMGAGTGTGEAKPAAKIEPPTRPLTEPQTGPERVGLPPRSLAVKRIGAALRLLIDMSTNPDSPLAAIDKVGIANGRFVISDRAAGESRVYQDLNLALEKGGGTNFSLSADGPNGTWSLSASASGLPTGTRRLDIEAKNISMDEILLVSGSRKMGVDFDMPLSSKFSLALAPDGGLTEIAGDISLGTGYLRFDDPNDEPKMLDSVETSFHWDRSLRRVALDQLRIKAGSTDFNFQGTLVPPSREGDFWQLDVANAQPELYGAERPGESPITLTHFNLGARLNLTQKLLVLDQFNFSGPDCSFAMTGTVDWVNGPHVRLGASLGPTKAMTAVRLWPAFVVAPVRSWFLSHWKAGVIQGGRLQLDFDEAMIKAMRLQHAPPDKNFAMDFTIANGAVAFLEGVPPVQNINGIGHITGRTSTFTASSGALDAGSGGPLTISQAVFHVANGEMKPTPGQLTAQVSGSVEAVAALLQKDALKPYASLPVDPASLKGQIAGTLGVGIRMGPVVKPEDIQLTVNAMTANLSAEHLVGKQSLEDGNLNVIVDPTGMKAIGQGKLFGAPANIDIEKPVNQQATASVSIVLDDAARAKQGLGSLSELKGPITAKLTAPLGAPPPMKSEVELDLTRAAITGVPGVSKPAGKPGKVSFNLTVDEKGTQIDQLAVDAAPIQARGAVQLGSDFSLIGAKFSQVKFSQGDDMRVEVAKAGEGYKVTIRGAVVDARPFLRNLTFSKSDHGEADAAAQDDDDSSAKDAAGGKDVEIDLKANSLVGYNKTTLSGADLHMVRRGENLRQFSVGGHFGHASISGLLTNPNSPSPELDLRTGNAGALLAFLDLYRHMQGGDLDVAMRLGNDALAGALKIRNFVVQDEPALARLVTEGAQQRPVGVDAPTTTQPPPFDPNSVSFKLLQVNFQRAGSRLDVRDGTMYGTEMGLKIDGWLDFARDRVSMDGTFVPAYGVNNLFAQVPLFGIFLGGGPHEGLFAINYHITGQASKPTLSVNALTAIAPGFLRKIFGALDLSSPAYASPDAAAPAQSDQ